MRKKGSVFTATFFIAGACIGVSYFTVPILTGIAGFIPAVVLTFVAWGFSLSIGLLYAEATLGQPDGANLVSISRVLLGKVWMTILSLVFFIITMSYLTAYTFFTEHFLQTFFKETFHTALHPFLGGLLCTLPLLFIIFLGIHFSCRANVLLMIGLAISFFLTIYLGTHFIVTERLFKLQWIYILFAVPNLFSAFGFVVVIPSLCTYLNRDAKKIRLSIILGTLITLVVYLFWQWFMIGSISAGTLWVNYEEGANIDKVFSIVEHFPHITYFLNFTLFFSMVTSFIANGIAVVDFLGDGFKLPLAQRTGWKRLAICGLVLLIVLPFSLIRGHPFLHVIQNFGAPLGEVMLNGIIPVWMVAQARYFYSIRAPQLLPGGQFSLIILGIAIFILIYLEGIVFIRS